MNVAANEARFDEASASLARSAPFTVPTLVAFACECTDPNCAQVVRLSLAEYAALRLYANRFVVSRSCASGELAGTLALEETDRFRVVDRLATE